MPIWAILSDADKESCFDPTSAPYIFKVNLFQKFKGWKVQGPLGAEWTLTVLPTLLSVANEQNITDQIVFGTAGHVKSYLPLWSLYLVGKEPQHEYLTPTILALHKDVKVARQASNILKQLRSTNAVLRDLLTGYDFYYAEDPVKLCADVDSMSTTSDDEGEEEKVSLCGAHVVIRSEKTEHLSEGDISETWTHSTIGGTVCIKKQWYATTAAHAFLADSSLANVTGQQKCSIYVHSNHVEATNEDDLRIAHPLPDPSNRIAYECEFAFDMQIVSADNASNTIILNRKDDWALIPIQNPRFATANFIELENEGIERICGVTSTRPSQPVLVLSSVTKPSTAVLLETPSATILPDARNLTLVWAVERRSNAGDCGSWVVDVDGNVFAMVVAASESEDITFCVPFSKSLIDAIRLCDETPERAMNPPSDNFVRASARINIEKAFSAPFTNRPVEEHFDDQPCVQVPAGNFLSETLSEKGGPLIELSPAQIDPQFQVKKQPSHAQAQNDVLEGQLVPLAKPANTAILADLVVSNNYNTLSPTVFAESSSFKPYEAIFTSAFQPFTNGWPSQLAQRGCSRDRLVEQSHKGEQTPTTRGDLIPKYYAFAVEEMDDRTNDDRLQHTVSGNRLLLLDSEANNSRESEDSSFDKILTQENVDRPRVRNMNEGDCIDDERPAVTDEPNLGPPIEHIADKVDNQLEADWNRSGQHGKQNNARKEVMIVKKSSPHTTRLRRPPQVSMLQVRDKSLKIRQTSTTTRVSKKVVDPLALDKYGVPWKEDDEDDFWIIVHDQLSTARWSELKDYTRHLHREREASLAVAKHHAQQHMADSDAVNSDAVISERRPFEPVLPPNFDPDEFRILPMVRDNINQGHNVATDSGLGSLDQEFESKVREILEEAKIPTDFVNHILGDHTHKERQKREYVRQKHQTMKDLQEGTTVGPTLRQHVFT